jgi:hypothetical protein
MAGKGALNFGKSKARMLARDKKQNHISRCRRGRGSKR